MVQHKNQYGKTTPIFDKYVVNQNKIEYNAMKGNNYKNDDNPIMTLFAMVINFDKKITYTHSTIQVFNSVTIIGSFLAIFSTMKEVVAFLIYRKYNQEQSRNI